MNNGGLPTSSSTARGRVDGKGQLYHVQRPSGRPLGPLKLAQIKKRKVGVSKKGLYLARGPLTSSPAAA